VLTQTLVVVVLALTACVGLSAVTLSATWSLALIALFGKTRIVHEVAAPEELLPPEEPEVIPAGPLTQPRVLHCSSCRGLARRGVVAPLNCTWCDRCEADTLYQLITRHAQTKVELAMANNFLKGKNGRPDLDKLRKLVATCYRSELGA